jgi:diguanylate cyclase (GGDEF)-like protein
MIVALQLMAVLAAAAPGVVGSPTVPDGHYHFQAYGPDEGFPSLSIHAISQDVDGYIWLGTETGLVRYDGARMQRWGQSDGLPSDWVTRIVPDPRGGLWLNTTRGPARFRDGKGRPIAFAGQEQPAATGSLDFDGQGRLLIPGRDCILVQDGPDTLAVMPGWPGGSVTSVRHGGRSGGLWVVSGPEVVQRQADGTWRRFGAKEGIAMPPVTAVEDGEGWVWAVGARTLKALAPGARRFVDRSNWLPGTFSNSMQIFPDGEGALWVPTTDGVVRLLGESHRVVGAAQGLPTTWARAAFRDREGSLWVSSASLYRMLGQGLVSAFTRAEGLGNEVVWAVVRDREGVVWAGSDDGLFRLEAGGWKAVPGTRGAGVYGLAVDPSGDLWIANASGRSLHLRRGAGRAEPIDALPGSGRATRVGTLKDGRVWLAVVSVGLIVYDPRERRAFTSEVFQPGLESYGLQGVVEGPEGRLWLWGNKGILCLQGGRIVPIGEREGLASDRVLGVALADDGSAWVWYEEPKGLTHLRLEGDRVRLLEPLGVGRRLTSNLVYGLVPHPDGLWVSTDQGLCEVRGGATRPIAYGDGLVSNDCNDKALFLDAQQNLWVGTTAGIGLVRTAGLPPVPPPPGAQILRLDVGRPPRAVPLDALAPIDHRDATLELFFSAPTYLDERALRFQVRLLGLQDAWEDTGLRQARYVALVGGEYRFEVRAARRGGEFGPPAGVDLVVLAPWWRRWWFVSLEVLAGLALLAGLFRWRLRTLRQQKARLELLVAERTRDLQEANRALEEQSLTDPLTGLRNRRFLRLVTDTDLAQVLRSRHPAHGQPGRAAKDLLFFILDIDEFKSVNDTYGHQAGDDVIVQLSALLTRVVRATDTVVRWGGEEFVVVTRGTTRELGAVVAEKLRSAIEAHPFRIADGTVLHRTCSIGFAAFPFYLAEPKWASWEQVVDLADRGLYLVKTHGRNGWAGVAAGPSLDLGQTLVEISADVEAAVATGRLEVQACRPGLVGR